MAQRGDGTNSASKARGFTRSLSPPLGPGGDTCHKYDGGGGVESAEPSRLGGGFSRVSASGCRGEGP